jgi:regulator of protease activity HflC (stomatin/prohibitin superfamily)
MNIAQFLINNWWIIILVIIFLGSFFTVNQGYVGVVTMFGKYKRAARPGLNMKLPILEQVMKKISVQNRSVEL